MIVDKQSPVKKPRLVEVIARRCDPVDVEVVEFAIERTIVGEAAGFGDCIESIDGSIARRFARIAARSLAVAGDRD